MIGDRRGYGIGMTETHEPNEYGFAGGATTPEPASAADAEDAAATGTAPGTESTTDPVADLDEGNVSVPAGDLTGAISDAISDPKAADDQR
jgi:hypothetical protein